MSIFVAVPLVRDCAFAWVWEVSPTPFLYYREIRYSIFMNYYFGYGSNMDQKQMHDRCPSAVLLGVAELRDYTLSFTIFSPKRQCGCADVEKKEKSSVYGILYELTDEDAKKMDEYEGSPEHYRRISVVVTQDGKEASAYTYEVVHKNPGVLPSKHYLGLITHAAEHFNFPKEYQEFLLSTPTLAIEPDVVL